jgi:hypothetical protein
MFKLDAEGNLSFNTKDLKEVYELIVTQFGFEYAPYLDINKKGLVWTKLYESDTGDVDLCPIMVIREADSYYAEAAFFSTNLYWEGFSLYVNPNEFDDESGDEVEVLTDIIKSAQKEVNEVLEECRQQLAAKFTEIKNNLIKDAVEDTNDKINV